MDVKVGSRVIVERHQDMANSNLSLDYKKGLVIGTYQESHWGGVHVETYYVICLDRPLCKLSPKFARFSSLSRCPKLIKNSGNRILFTNQSELSQNSSVSILVCSSTAEQQDLKDALFPCRYPNCENVYCPLGMMVDICGQHLICPQHVMPWDNRASSPEWSNPVVVFIYRKLEEQQHLLDMKEIRALLFVRLSPPSWYDSRNDLVNPDIVSLGVSCCICKKHCNPFNRLSQQFIPPSQRDEIRQELRRLGILQRCQFGAHIIGALQKVGATMSEINKLQSAQVNLGADLFRIDADIAIALYNSQKSSSSFQLEQPTERLSRESFTTEVPMPRLYRANSLRTSAVTSKPQEQCTTMDTHVRLFSPILAGDDAGKEMLMFLPAQSTFETLLQGARYFNRVIVETNLQRKRAATSEVLISLTASEDFDHVYVYVLSGDSVPSLPPGSEKSHGPYQGPTRRIFREITGGYICEGNCSITDIQPDEQIYVWSGRGNIGPISSYASVLADFSHNTAMVSQARTYMDIFIGYRRIRGDGNCYYRAVLFNLLEQLIVRRDLSAFSRLADVFESIAGVSANCKLPGEEADYIWQNQEVGSSIAALITALRNAADGLRWRAIAEFEADVLFHHSLIDVGIVGCARRLTADYIIRNANEPTVSGMTLMEAIASYNTDFQGGLREYLCTSVETHGRDAEGVKVDLGILLTRLNCRGATIVLGRGAQSSFMNKTEASSVVTPMATIFILLRPGHFDLLYPGDADVAFQTRVIVANVCEPKQVCGHIVEESVTSRLTAFQVKNASGEYQRSIENVDSACSSNKKENGCLNCQAMSTNTKLFQISSCCHVICQKCLVSYLHSNAKERPTLSAEFDRHDIMKVGHTANKVKSIYTFSKIPRPTTRGANMLPILLPISCPSAGCTSLLDRSIVPSEFELDFSQSTIELNEVCSELLDCRFCILCDEGYQPLRCFNRLDCDHYVHRSCLQLFLAREIGKCQLIACPGCVNEKIKCRCTNCIPRDTKGPHVLTEPEMDMSLLPDDPFMFEIIWWKSALPLRIELVLDTSTVKCPNHPKTYTAVVNLDQYPSITDLINGLSSLAGIEESFEFENSSDDFMAKLLSMAELFKLKSTTPSVNIALRSIKCVVCSNPTQEASRHKMSRCQHTVCTTCLTNAVRSSAQDRESLTKEFDEYDDNIVEAVQTTKSIYKFPNIPRPIPENFIPDELTLIRIKCPAPNCACELCERDLPPEFSSDYTKSLQELHNYCKEMRGCGKCFLSNLVCLTEAQPFRCLIRLGCDHCVHKGCLLPSLRTEIEKGEARLYTCQACVSERTKCHCYTCNDLSERGPHVFTEAELRPLFTDDPKTFDKWSALQARSVMSKIGDLVTCNKCGSSFLDENRRNSVITCGNTECGHQYCRICELPPHPNKTCDVARDEMVEQGIKDAGLTMLQKCPKCPKRWSVPIECLHVTCESTFGGCGFEFCFLCTGPHRAIVAHGNYYHLPACGFFDNHCCENKCIINGHVNCLTKDKRCPPPCTKCNKSKCEHVCAECEKSTDDKICRRPGLSGTDHANGGKIFAHEEVKEEQEKLAAGAAKSKQMQPKA